MTPSILALTTPVRVCVVRASGSKDHEHVGERVARFDICKRALSKSFPHISVKVIPCPKYVTKY